MAHQQVKKTRQVAEPKAAIPLQMTMTTNLVITCKIAPVKSNPFSKKAVCFATKPTSRSTTSNPNNKKAFTSACKHTPVMTTIDFPS